MMSVNEMALRNLKICGVTVSSIADAQRKLGSMYWRRRMRYWQKRGAEAGVITADSTVWLDPLPPEPVMISCAISV